MEVCHANGILTLVLPCFFFLFLDWWINRNRENSGSVQFVPDILVSPKHHVLRQQKHSKKALQEWRIKDSNGMGMGWEWDLSPKNWGKMFLDILSWFQLIHGLVISETSPMWSEATSCRTRSPESAPTSTMVSDVGILFQKSLPRKSMVNS